MPKENHLNEIMKHLPLIEMDSKAGRSSKPWKEWIEHPTYDNYWKDLNLIEENILLIILNSKNASNKTSL